MDPKEHRESLMEASGLGLLPGLVLALALIVFAMAALLTGSIWAVAGVLAVIGLIVALIVFMVIALTAEGEEGAKLRAKVPGLGDR